VKIESIERRRYVLPLDPPFIASWDPQPRRTFTTDVIIVRAGGFDGVGSGDAMPGFAGHEHLFVGHDALDLERHCRIIDNLSFHYGRMWPLDIALHDLASKARGLPLWRLLGAASGRVRVYASTGERRPVDERIASVLALREQGFGAVKLRFHAPDPADDIAVLRAVREAAGGSMEIMVDANQGWRMPWDVSDPWTYEIAARVAGELRDLGVYWLEEPLHRHDVGGMARLRREVPGIRIAGGEGARELIDAWSCLDARALDVYQQDVAWSSGVAGAMRLAQRVRDAGAVYSPHTWGDGVVLLANLHVAAAASNAAFIEYPYDPPGWTPERRDFLLAAPIAARDGYVDLGTNPGLGASIDWPAIEEHRIA
jgi:L-alanine-DL-glutamate epimerase-like enolase superfamily enzyme